MRLAASSIPLLLAALATLATLAGCQALAPAADPAAGPHASVAGTHADAAQRVDTFRVLAIDGRNVLPITDEPAKLIGHDTTYPVAAGRAVRLEIEGFAFYDNTVRRLFWDPMRAQGVVEFVPAAGASYSLHGAIAPELSSVWIEDDATHEVVAHKISVTGHGPAAAEAASAAPSMARGGN